MGGVNGTTPEGARTGAEIRAMREYGVWQTLLSGFPVRIRTVTPDALLQSGTVPDILTPLVTRMMFEHVETKELDAFLAKREEAKEALEVVKSINAVCKAALVYPRIVENPQADDEICAEDLNLADRGWIFKLAFMPAEVLKQFRLQPDRNVEVVPDGEIDEQQAEPVDVYSGQVSSVPV